MNGWPAAAVVFISWKTRRASVCKLRRYSESIAFISRAQLSSRSSGATKKEAKRSSAEGSCVCWTEKWKPVASIPVNALLWPPCFERNSLNELSSGKGSVPRKSMCSAKCASPGMSSGSLKWPARISIAAAALSASGSHVRKTLSPFSSATYRYLRSSFGGARISSSTTRAATLARGGAWRSGV